MNKAKRLILIRHAHRDTDEGRSRDNGLSEKGQDQVKRLLRFVTSKVEDSEEVVVFSSPKKRCQETIMPIAKAFKVQCLIDGRVNEHGVSESARDYSLRMDDFLEFWKKECPETTIVCSHGDWIPTAVHKLTGAKIGLKKAGYVEMEWLDPDVYLTWIIQKHV
jgi:broad specificity phosphatase PhoE